MGQDATSRRDGRAAGAAASPRPTAFRPRFHYALAIGGTIVLGLLSRRFPLLGKYPGDALWALMIFYAAGLILPRARSRTVAALAFGFCVAIEFLKLNQTPWLVSARSSVVGHLVFGHVFSWQNLVAHAAGILLGLIIEREVARWKSRAAFRR